MWVGKVYKKNADRLALMEVTIDGKSQVGLHELLLEDIETIEVLNVPCQSTMSEFVSKDPVLRI